MPSCLLATDDSIGPVPIGGLVVWAVCFALATILAVITVATVLSPRLRGRSVARMTIGVFLASGLALVALAIGFSSEIADRRTKPGGEAKAREEQQAWAQFSIATVLPPLIAALCRWAARRKRPGVSASGGNEK